MLFSTALTFAALAAPTLGLVARAGNSTTKVDVVATFPANIHPENLVIRPNGLILLTAADNNSLIQVDPSKKTQPKIVHTFSGVTSLSGIAEVKPDVYALAVGNFSYSTDVPSGTPHSWSLFTIDLTRKQPTVKNITFVRDGIVPNGLAFVGNDYVLLSDSAVGVIFRINICTGALNTLGINEPLFKQQFFFGINGIQLVKPGQLDFVNTDLNLIGKVKVDSTGQLLGNASVIASNISNTTADENASPDDFINGPSGALYVTSETEIVVVNPDGNRKHIVLNSNPSRVTAVKFGRTTPYKNTLFGFVINFIDNHTAFGTLVSITNI